MTAGRRWQLLAVGGLLFVIVMVALRRGDGPPAGSGATPSNTARRAADAGEAEGVDVKLELLQADRDSMTRAVRNPFRFEATAPPPRTVRQDLPDGPPVFSPPAAPAGPMPPPPIPLRYIGFFAAEGMLTAAFTDGRGNDFHGREGDIIEGRYKVMRVGTESVELAYLDGRGRQTIRLSGL